MYLCGCDNPQVTRRHRYKYRQKKGICTKLPAFFCTKYWILGVRFLAKRLDMVRTYSALPVLLLPALPRAPVSSMSPEPQSETIDAHWWNHDEIWEGPWIPSSSSSYPLHIPKPDEIMMKSFETTSDSLFPLVFRATKLYTGTVRCRILGAELTKIFANVDFLPNGCASAAVFYHKSSLEDFGSQSRLQMCISSQKAHAASYTMLHH